MNSYKRFARLGLFLTLVLAFACKTRADQPSMFQDSSVLTSKREQQFRRLYNQSQHTTRQLQISKTKLSIQDCADDEMRLEFYKLEQLMDEIEKGRLAGFRLKFVEEPTKTEICVMSLGNGHSIVVEPQTLSATQLKSLHSMPMQGQDNLCKVIDFESNEVLYFHFDKCPFIVDNYSFLYDFITDTLQITDDAIVYIDLMRI